VTAIVFDSSSTEFLNISKLFYWSILQVMVQVMLLYI